MRSIPATMTWEIFARGRWGLAAATLGAIGFPAIIFTALEIDGALNPQDSSMLTIHIAMMHFNVLMFASAVLGAQGRMSHLYAYPVRASTIVAWRLLPAMVIVFLQAAVSIAVLNALFRLDWSIWGPACFIAVAFAAVQAALWLTDKSLLWSIAVLTLVAGVLGMWFKARYGEAFGGPTHYWHQLTPAEVATMLAIAVTAYWIAVVAVARNRRGDPPLSLGIINWLYRYFESASFHSRSWATPARAHFWCEFRRKGWAMPLIAFGLLAAALIVWLFVSRNPDDLIVGLLGSTAMLFVLSFICGLILGRLGSTDSDSAMGQFLATRPMTDTQMARITVRVAALSVLLTWLIWAAAFLVTSIILLAAGAGQSIRLPQPFGWWTLPGSLLAMWTFASVLASIVMAGSTRIFQVMTAMIPASIVLTLFSKFALTQETQLLFLRIVVAIVAAAILVVTAWIFAAAHRRTLIHSPTIWTAAALWAAAFVLVVLQWPAHLEPNWLAYLLAAAAFALAVAPLAAAPLALSWNRHR